MAKGIQTNKKLAALHRMASGLIHTSDSNQGDERGAFVDFFGAPGNPKEKNAVVSDDTSYPGRAPALGKKWMRGGSGSIGRGKN